MTKHTSFIKAVTLVSLLSLSAVSAYAWTAPTQNPPAGNIDTPINTGTTDQSKLGGITSGGNITAWSFIAPYFRLATTTTAGYVLTSDAIGNASWEAATGGSLPAGTDGQTLRHNGTDWIANSGIFNNGTNVGIGTTTPAFKLDINNPAGTIRTGLRLGYNGLNDLFLTDNGASVSSNLYYSGGWKYNGTNTGTLFGMANGALSFYTAPSGATSTAATLTNAMQITNAGNIGIGTTTPTTKFHVVSSGVGGVGNLGIFENATSTANAYSQIGIRAGSATSWIWTMNQNSTLYGGANSLNIYAGAGGAMTLWTNATEKVRIDTAGNVGIGTTAPSNKLEVAGGSIFAHGPTGGHGRVTMLLDGSDQ
ncbi:MAG: hypothetical protein WC791_02090, partial [Candidatus Paceibacterota bacterium]